MSSKLKYILCFLFICYLIFLFRDYRWNTNINDDQVYKDSIDYLKSGIKINEDTIDSLNNVIVIRESMIDSISQLRGVVIKEREKKIEDVKNLPTDSGVELLKQKLSEYEKLYDK